MEFKEFKKMLQDNFAELSKDATHLFEVDANKDKMWDLYLESFLPQFNKIFRENREHDCNCCKSFIRQMANTVFIKDNKTRTIWDLQTGSEEYQPSVDALHNYISSLTVHNIHVMYDREVGTDGNFEFNNPEIYWNHLFLNVPSKFVTNSTDSEGSIQNEYKTKYDALKRGLNELTLDALETVLDWGKTKAVYKTDESVKAIQTFMSIREEYIALETDEEKDNFIWLKSTNTHISVCRLRGSSIGTLLVNLSENMELELAVKKFMKVVDPSNFQRKQKVYTKRMLDDARKTAIELGFEDSFGRRHATLDDISINNILFSNKDASKRIKGGMDVFDKMSEALPVQVKNYARVEEMPVDIFLSELLPTATAIELLLENKHKNNMMSLIAPTVSDSKSMFKWDNAFSWAYSGNITDSAMKDRVKSAGGDVTGDLRFSIQWNEAGIDITDLDAHCQEPVGGSHISYSQLRSRGTCGVLDVDIQVPRGTAVENITWSTRDKMIDGVYKLYVDDYSKRGAKGGFRAEVEFDGQIYSFDCPPFTSNKRVIQVAEVTLKNGAFTIVEKLESTISSKDVWGVKTNKFIPVSVACFSPNYWDEQMGIGNQHLFFMLDKCVNEEQPNGFYNEFLSNDLSKHKTVFESLGSTMSVEYVEDQLSGVGFSLSRRGIDVVVKVTSGTTEKVVKIII